MKKKNKKNNVRSRLSTILLCILAILLCAAPALHAADETVSTDQTKIIDYPVTGFLWIHGIANLMPGASVSQYIYVQDGGTLNMYSGTIGTGCFINVGSDAASITIYGTEFEVDGYPCDYGEVTLTGGRGTLTGEYGDESSIDLWIFSDTPINLQPPPISGPEKIQIDIKPGGNPNNINLKSNGVVPVAVLTTDGFDASDVDPTSVVFAGASPVRWSLCDVDDDGDLDMLYHFKTQKLNLDKDSTEATLTGMMTSTITSMMMPESADGKVIQGTDTVRILSQKKK